MIKMPLSIIRVAALCLPLALVASCGTESEAVQGTVVNIDPPAVGQQVPANGTSSIVDEIFTIEAMSPSGYPQVGVQMIVSSPGVLSDVDKSSGTAVITPKGAAGETYIVTTDSNGVYTVAVSFTSGVGADGDVTILSAWSGTGYNRVNITYECFDAGGVTCQ